MSGDVETVLVPGPESVDLSFSCRVAGHWSPGSIGHRCGDRRRLRREGRFVAVVDVKAEAATAAAAALGPRHIGIDCDVTSAVSVAAAVDDAVAHLGGLDIVVNCAGVAVLDAAESLAASAWATTLAVNLTGTFLVAQAAGRVMLDAGHGRVINLASQAGTVAIDGHAAYSASSSGSSG